MSALVLPDRRIALPGRRPGPAEALRRWLDRLILPFQKWDVGGCDCNCSSGCTNAKTPGGCTLPATNLTVSRATGGICTPDPQSVTLLYAGGCAWNSACFNATCSGVPLGFKLYMGVLGTGCFYLGIASYSSGCTGTPAYSTYQNPAGCANGTVFPGGTSSTGTLQSVSCSPLNIAIKIGSSTFTVTP